MAGNPKAQYIVFGGMGMANNLQCIRDIRREIEQPYNDEMLMQAIPTTRMY